jgi:hypothetical protein
LQIALGIEPDDGIQPVNDVESFHDLRLLHSIPTPSVGVAPGSALQVVPGISAALKGHRCMLMPPRLQKLRKGRELQVGLRLVNHGPARHGDSAVNGIQPEDGFSSCCGPRLYHSHQAMPLLLRCGVGVAFERVIQQVIQSSKRLREQPDRIGRMENREIAD